MKKENGKQSVSINIEARIDSEKNVWYFCQNGHKSTGVSISVEQFDILKELVNDHRIVEHYESMRHNQ
jgi:hypothetical protein